MTKEHEASRTLVKSPPELWAECSDAGSLARHLGEFGEIKITRLEPETTVAWEGEHASGTVRIEPAGWGTRVTLTAQTEAEAVPEPVDPDPVEAEEVPEPDDPDPIEAEASGAEEPSGEEEIMADQGQLSDDDPPTATEEDDATVEEAVEVPDPVLASDSGAFRIRWRRVKGRMRGLFGPRDALEAPESTVLEEVPRSVAEEPVASVSEEQVGEEPVGSVPPPVGSDPTDVDEPELAVSSQLEPERAEPEPPSEPEPDASGDCDAEAEFDAQAVLSSALDSLGQAHHRPFSRA